MEQKKQRAKKTKKQLESYIRQEGDNIILPQI